MSNLLFFFFFFFVLFFFYNSWVLTIYDIIPLSFEWLLLYPILLTNNSAFTVKSTSPGEWKYNSSLITSKLSTDLPNWKMPTLLFHFLIISTTKLTRSFYNTQIASLRDRNRLASFFIAVIYNCLLHRTKPTEWQLTPLSKKRVLPKSTKSNCFPLLWSTMRMNVCANDHQELRNPTYITRSPSSKLISSIWVWLTYITKSNMWIQ